MAKKTGLGKGLGALLGSSGAADAMSPKAAPSEAVAQALADGAMLIELDPADIKANPKQPRTHFDEEALQELAASIKRDGVMEPVLVRQAKGGGYELISGERRVRASVMADLPKIPAVVRAVSDRDMLRLGLIENIQREDLNPIETAEAYQLLVDEFGWTQEQLADEVGKQRATVANMLRLLKLEPHVRELVAKGQLSGGHARALLAVSDPAQQLALAKRALRDGLSVRMIEEMTAKLKAGKEKKPAAAPDPNITSIEDKLRRRLGTKVHVKHQPGNKGRIEIEYYSLDEFERILDLLGR